MLPSQVQRHTKNFCVFWGQTVCEEGEESNLPLQCLHPCNFLPLPFNCQACHQGLYSGLRIYSKLLHHCTCMQALLWVRLGGEACFIISFPSLLKTGLPKGSSCCIPGIALDLGAFVHLLIIPCEKAMCLYKCICRYIFFRILYLF